MKRERSILSFVSQSSFPALWRHLNTWGPEEALGAGFGSPVRCVLLSRKTTLKVWKVYGDDSVLLENRSSEEKRLCVLRVGSQRQWTAGRTAGQQEAL